VRTIFGRLPDLRPADAYAAADAVVLASTWEGFGNPTVESAIHRRPLAVARYPVVEELLSFGFRWFPIDDSRPLRRWLEAPDEELLEHNARVARTHFSTRRLTVQLDELLRTAGWRS
jgi:glycosyltransferase involved in cell wall biosynthesis